LIELKEKTLFIEDKENYFYLSFYF